MDFVVVATGGVSERAKYVSEGGPDRGVPFDGQSDSLPGNVDETWENAYELVLSFRSSEDLNSFGESRLEQDQKLREGVRAAVPLIEKYFDIEVEWHASIHRDTDNPHIHITYHRKDNIDKGLPTGAFHKLEGTQSEIGRLFFEGFGFDQPEASGRKRTKNLLVLDKEEIGDRKKRAFLEASGFKIVRIEDLRPIAPDAGDNSTSRILSAITRMREEDGEVNQVFIITKDRDLIEAARKEGEQWAGFPSIVDFEIHKRLAENGVRLLPQYIPETLKSLNQWGSWVWGHDFKNNEPRLTKIAINIGNTRYKARSNNPDDWYDYQKAFRFVVSRQTCDVNYFNPDRTFKEKRKEKVGGLSFQLREGDGIVAIDLDKCVNPETGAINPKALEIVQQVKGYWEISPSGKGLRGYVIGAAQRSGKGNGEESWIEVYDHHSARYMSVTGNRLSFSEAEPIANQEGLDWLHEKYLKKEMPVTAPSRPIQSDMGRRAMGTGQVVTEDLLIEVIRNSRSGGKFLTLYSGDAEGEDRSRNDARFVRILAYFTQDKGLIDSVFRGSGRMRPKWNQSVGKGLKYSDYVINFCLVHTEGAFDWDAYWKRESRKKKPEKVERKIEQPNQSRNFRLGGKEGKVAAATSNGAASESVIGQDEEPPRPSINMGSNSSPIDSEEFAASGDGTPEQLLFALSDQRLLNVISSWVKPEDIENDPNHLIRLWAGETGRYRQRTDGNETENQKVPLPDYGDYLLARRLAYYSDDAAQIERLMRQSARVRVEWDTTEPIKRIIANALSKARSGKRYDWSKAEEFVREAISGTGDWEKIDAILNRSIQFEPFNFLRNLDKRVQGLPESAVLPEAGVDAEQAKRIAGQQLELRNEFRLERDEAKDRAGKGSSGFFVDRAEKGVQEDDLGLLRKLTRFTNRLESLVSFFRKSRRLQISRKSIPGDEALYKLAKKALNRPHQMIDWRRYLLGRLKIGGAGAARLTLVREIFTPIKNASESALPEFETGETLDSGLAADNKNQPKMEKMMNEKNPNRPEGVFAGPGRLGSGSNEIEGELIRPRGERPGTLAEVVPGTSGKNFIEVDAKEVILIGSREQNYRLPADENYEYPPKVRFLHLIESLKTLKELRLRGLEEGGRAIPTDDEKRKLALFPGFGAFPSDLFRGVGDWRKEHATLKTFLTKEEWDSAQGSHVNAMYTHPKVGRVLWEMIDKLGMGEVGKLRVLEPSIGANGVLFSSAPEKFQDSIREAVELDTLSNEIATYLFPNDIIHEGNYGEVNLPRDYFDLVIGNPPYGTGRLFSPVFANDPVVSKCPNHEVFMAKAVRELREGGILIFVNSRYFMDKSDPVFRQWMADRANLVSAFRLPSGAFKKNAGTEVVTDILIFQKRGPSIPAGDQKWVEAQDLSIEGKTIAGKYLNTYFANHPAHVLGTPKIGHGMHGIDLLVEAPEDLDSRLEIAALSLPDLRESLVSGILEKPRGRVLIEDTFLPYRVEGTTLFKITKEGGKETRTATKVLEVAGKNGFEELQLTTGDIVRIRELIDLASSLRRVYELDELGSEDADAERQILQEKYSAFRGLRGPLDTPENRRLLNWHPDRSLLFSLEVKGKTADILKGPVARRREESKIDSVENAVWASINSKSALDPRVIAQKLGRAPEAVLAELLEKKLAFFDPLSGKLLPHLEYLSGDVREKLRQVESVVRVRPEFARNVEALNEVLPKWRNYDEIPVRLGKPFIPAHYYERFLFESARQKYDPATGKSGKQEISVTMNPHSGSWTVESQYLGQSVEDLRNHFATNKATWEEVIEAAFNGKAINIKKKGGEIDESAVADIEARIEKAHDMFKRWLWTGEVGEKRQVFGSTAEIVDRRKVIEEIYNNTMNSVITPKYTGEGITFSGMAVEVDPRDWQRAAVQEVINRRASLVTRDVGGGKTAFSAMTVAKLQEIGQVEKGVFVVKKSNLIQFEHEIRKFFPTKRILSTTGLKDWGAKHATLTQCLTNHFDFIVLTYEDFQRIPIHPANFERLVRAEVERVKQAFHEELQAEKKSRVKHVEKRIAEIEARIAQRYHQAVKDNLYQFDPDQQVYIKARLNEFEDRAKRITGDLIKNSETQLNGLLAGASKGTPAGKLSYVSISEMRIKAPFIKWEEGGVTEELKERSKEIANRVQEEVQVALREIALERKDYLEDLILNTKVDSKLLTWERIIGTESIAFIADEVDDKVRGMGHPEAPSFITSIKGVPDGVGSDMAVDFQMKLGILHEQTDQGAKHVELLMTATPIVNTAVEIYNWGKMLNVMPPGVNNLQNFVNNYLHVSPRVEKTIDGFKAVTRVRGYESIPDMVRWAKSFVTFGTGTAADLNPPDVQFLVAVSPVTEYEEFLLQEIANKARSLGKQDTGERLRLINELKQISVHTPLLYRDDIERNPLGKIEMTAEMLAHLHRAYPDTTHLVFTDYGVHENQKGVSAVHDFISELAKHGIPKSKVINFSEISSDEERFRAQERLNNGDAIVAIGSTARLGTGTNVQKRALSVYLLHDGYSPRNAIQCIGRAERPGNDNEAIQVVRVVKEGVDDFFAKYLSIKTEIINEFMAWVRSDIEEVPLAYELSEDDLSAEQIAAIASRDHLALKLHQLQLNLDKLERKEGAFRRGQINSLGELSFLEKNLAQKVEEQSKLDGLVSKIIETEGLKFCFKLSDGTEINDREAAGKAIIEGHKVITQRRENGYQLLGFFRGARIASLEEYTLGSLGLPQRGLIMDFEGHQRNLIFDEEKAGDIFRIINVELGSLKRDFENNQKRIGITRSRIEEYRAEVFEPVKDGEAGVEKLRPFPELAELEATHERVRDILAQIELRGTKPPELDGRAKICRNSRNGFVEMEYREGLNVGLYRRFEEQVRLARQMGEKAENPDVFEFESSAGTNTGDAAEVKAEPSPTPAEPSPTVTSAGPQTMQATNAVVLVNPDGKLKILLGETRNRASDALLKFVIHIGNFDFIAKTTGIPFGQVNGERTKIEYRNGWEVRWLQSGDSTISKKEFEALLKEEASGTIKRTEEKGVVQEGAVVTGSQGESGRHETGVETTNEPESEEMLPAEAIVAGISSGDGGLESPPESETHPVLFEIPNEESSYRFTRLILIQTDAAVEKEIDRVASALQRFLIPTGIKTMVGVGNWKNTENLALIEERFEAAKPAQGKFFGVEFTKVNLDEETVGAVGRILDRSGYASERGGEFSNVEEFFADQEETTRNYSLLVVTPLAGPILETALGKKSVAIGAYRYKERIDEKLLQNFDEMETLVGGDISDVRRDDNRLFVTGPNGVWSVEYSIRTYGEAIDDDSFIFTIEQAIAAYPEVSTTREIVSTPDETTRRLDEVSTGTELPQSVRMEDPAEIGDETGNNAKVRGGNLELEEEAKTVEINEEPSQVAVLSEVPEEVPVRGKGANDLIVGFVAVREIETQPTPPQEVLEQLQRISALLKKEGLDLTSVDRKKLAIVIEEEMQTKREQAKDVFEQMDQFFERRSSKIPADSTVLDLRFQMQRLGVAPKVAFGGALKKAEALDMSGYVRTLSKVTNKEGIPLGFEVITDPKDLDTSQAYKLVGVLPRKAGSTTDVLAVVEHGVTPSGKRPSAITSALRSEGFDVIDCEKAIVLAHDAFVYEGPDVFEANEIRENYQDIRNFGLAMMKVKLEDTAFKTLLEIEGTERVEIEPDRVLVKAGKEMVSVDRIHLNLTDFVTTAVERECCNSDGFEKVTERHVRIRKLLVEISEELESINTAARLKASGKFDEALLDHCEDSLQRRYAAALLQVVEKGDVSQFKILTSVYDVQTEMPDVVKGRLEAYRSVHEAAGKLPPTAEGEVWIREKAIQKVLESSFGLPEAPLRNWGADDLQDFVMAVENEEQREALNTLSEALEFEKNRKELARRVSVESSKELATAIEEVIGKGKFQPAHCSRTVQVLGQAVLNSGVSPESGRAWKGICEVAVETIRTEVNRAKKTFSEHFPNANPNDFGGVVRMFADLGDSPVQRFTANHLAEKGQKELPNTELMARLLLAKMDEKPLERLVAWADKSTHSSEIQATVTTLVTFERSALSQLKPVEVSGFEASPRHSKMIAELVDLPSGKILEGAAAFENALRKEETKAEKPGTAVENLIRRFTERSLKGQLTYTEFVATKKEATSLLEDLGRRREIIETLTVKDFIATEKLKVALGLPVASLEKTEHGKSGHTQPAKEILCLDNSNGQGPGGQTEALLAKLREIEARNASTPNDFAPSM